jgi:hypothetical protein
MMHGDWVRSKEMLSVTVKPSSNDMKRRLLQNLEERILLTVDFSVPESERVLQTAVKVYPWSTFFLGWDAVRL